MHGVVEFMNQFPNKSISIGCAVSIRATANRCLSYVDNNAYKNTRVCRAILDLRENSFSLIFRVLFLNIYALGI